MKKISFYIVSCLLVSCTITPNFEKYSIKTENLDNKYKKLDDGYLNEFKNRVEISKTALQEKYANAVNSIF